MIIKKLMALLVLTMLVIGTGSAWANEDHACKTDADCEHGQHCKEGHCHE